MSKVTDELIDRARRKVLNTTPSKNFVSCICYDNRGRLLGITYNHPRINRKGGGVHAEMMALQRWGTRVHRIVLVRFGKSGIIRPIHPCVNCARVLNKIGIKVEPVEPVG